jgi:hypothetical protein
MIPIKIKVKLVGFSGNRNMATLKYEYQPIGDELELSVFRIFQLKDSQNLVLACGNDFDDNDLWLADGHSITLIGSIKAEPYQKIRRQRCLDITCSADSFEFVHRDFKGKHLVAHVEKLPLNEFYNSADDYAYATLSVLNGTN